MNPDEAQVLVPDIPAIMARYPFGDVVAWHALGGTSNTTYKVVTRQREIALRVYNPGHSPLQRIQFELSVLQHLASMSFDCPHPLAGNDGEILQPWNGCWVCASAFIPGISADHVELTPALVGDVGRLVAQLQSAMARWQTANLCPLPGDTFLERSRRTANLLETAYKSGELNLDVAGLLVSWKRSNELLARRQSNLNATVIHTDLWPPNVLCIENRVSGLVDFAECCYGAGFMDVAMALMEFSMYKSAVINEELAASFVAGFFSHGGTLSALEQSLLLDAMEIACAFWWTWEELEGPATVEGESYRQRLELFRTPDSRAKFSDDIDRLIAAGRTAVPESLANEM